MKNFLLLIFIITVCAFHMSCSKDEGYGGLAKIQGKVYGKDYNSSGNLVSEGYLGDVKVYISAHGNTAYFDDIDTAYDGSYTFNFLQEGTYDLWVFGDCDYCPFDQVYQLKTIEVGSRKATITVEDFVISF